MQLYTPFLTNAAEKFAGGYLQREQQNLAKSAYMGDPQAMATLSGFNPQMAAQIQQSINTRKQSQIAEQDRALKMQDRKRQIVMENREVMQGIFQQAAQQENPAAASALMKREVNKLVKDGILPEDSAEFMEDMDDQTFAQLQAAYGVGGLDANFENIQKLRKEYLGQSKEFQAQDSAFGRVIASAKDPSAAGDLALIFNYMKVLDPGSVVRESEFATAAGARGALDNVEKEGGFVPAFVDQAVNRLLDGTRLTIPQRDDFVNRARTLYDDAAQSQQKREARYIDLATRSKFDPMDVVGDSLVDFRPSEDDDEDTPSTDTGEGIKFLGFEE